MIKAIIFDCFGVLVGDGWLPYKTELFKQGSPEFLQATLLNTEADSGKISEKEFISGIATLANRTYEEVAHRINQNPVNEELVQYIRDELKPKYKIGMLSNAADNYLYSLFEPWQAALFDSVTLSCDTGYVKPDPRIYQAALADLGCAPEECLFIDDRIGFCDGAAAVGIGAIHHQSNEQTIANIVELTTID